MPNDFSRLWNVNLERTLLTDTMFSTISCNTNRGGCGNVEKALFRGMSSKCSICGKDTLVVNTFNQRNAVVSAITEEFVLNVFKQAINSSPQLSGNFYAKRNVTCPQLELGNSTAADIAILNKDFDGPVNPQDIECICEVKMSMIWNWSSNNRDTPIADYDSHAGRPSIYRTDSILKAIGKAAIIRSCPQNEKIPFIVIGNTPPPFNYRDKVDGTVKSGLIQKWISLTPKPLVVSSKAQDKRNPKKTIGFLRIDTINELQEFLSTLLSTEWQYVGAMVEAKKIGEILRLIDLSQNDESVGQQFLNLLPQASSLYTLR
ncbi:hypothetical protein [Dehalococcoides mccartyi]|uniref:Uncharacterized protein n=1 Tax=Dehalococcoides mccartyi (strain VS) TaxID=311424 RepID=D2BJR4_DEHMV|nr:hypothetical protein [Dehalococcoides mccartyi]ACZ62564.1 hypothetical protein DhcVS_1467 [Dehalococcoides mccartyi VS]